MQGVLVMSSDRQPLDPCYPVRARRLLACGKAAIFRHAPFTIILKERTAADSITHAHRVKLDPGSRVTGIAVLREDSGQVVWAAELGHRGQRIRALLRSRHAVRRSRRQRNTRYRPARFLNRRRRQGWLPPSLESRVTNIATWVERLRRALPIAAISVETVRFDLQAMENPEISGVEYQQGTLAGYEAREYLLETWQRKCAYCDTIGVPLQIEHIVARARSGSNRISNLTLSCAGCNDRKGTQTLADFLKDQPVRLAYIQAQAKCPLADATAVNTTRRALHRRLVATGLPVEAGTGGRTKWNRTRLGLPKAHWLDAACVGASTPGTLDVRGMMPLRIQAMGHGTRQMCRLKQGRPVGHRPRLLRFAGFRTGDIVRAHIPKGKRAGVEIGRISIRFRPAFLLNGHHVHPAQLTRLHLADGYAYSTRWEEPPSAAT